MRAFLPALALLGVLAISPANADADLSSEDVKVEMLNAAGEPESRAGAHPDLLRTTILADTGLGAEDAMDMVVDFPAGFGGDAVAVPPCSRSAFASSACPEDSKIGELIVETDEERLVSPIYSLKPGPNETIVFGGGNLLSQVKFIGTLRPSDYGLSMRMENLTQEKFFGEPEATTIEFWGVPADRQEGTSIPRRPLLTLPTRCDEPITMTVSARTWQRPDRWMTVSADTGIRLDGCADLAFAPSLGLDFSHLEADSPTGLDLELRLPRNSDPDGRAGSLVEAVSVLMPEGLVLSPGAVRELDVCSDEQFGLGTREAPRCPPSSRVGSVDLVVPQVEQPLHGSVHLGAERPGDRFRLFVAARGPGAEVKLVGSLRTDPRTGRLITSIPKLPATAFDRFGMHFDGGPGALLATPLQCGMASATATFTPSSGTGPVQSSDAAWITGPAGATCPDPAPFSPAFASEAGSPAAGRPTTFSTTLRRRDGEQLTDRFSVTMPPGLSAALGAVGRCPPAAAAAAACPASSRIGAIVAEVGSGPQPAPMHGDLFLTGPYRGAPFGFAIGLDAVIGPFDLGRIAIRGRLDIDPLSGRVTIEADSLPRLVEGLAIRIRTLGLDIDRPGFLRNPTSCAPAVTAATLRSVSGEVVRPSIPSRVYGCVKLPFRPRFALALSGRGERRGEKVGLRIAVRTPAGGANLRDARIALPAHLRLDAAGLDEICARRAALRGRCPDGARVGDAYGRTPILGEPLRGGVYVVQPRGEGNPDLWTNLEGGGLEISLRSRVSSRDGRFETRLMGLPDMPISTFQMSFASGSKGFLALAKGLCHKGRGARLSAAIDAEGQNSARRSIVVPISSDPDCAGRG